MVFASMFMVVLIASLVTVSRASTFGRKLVREWQDEDEYRPSQQILDIVAAMSRPEKVTPMPTSSGMSTNAPSVAPELVPAKGPAMVRVSA